MNVSSATSNSSLWQMLTARAAANARSGAINSSTANSTGNGITGDMPGAGDKPAVRPDSPPPMIMQVDITVMSTAQFADMGSMPPGSGDQREDPMASLNFNGNGSVWSDEFSPNQSGDAAQDLFKAIDGGDGSLYAPPSPLPGESSWDAGSTDATGGGAGRSKIDVHAFIDQLAARYASMAADSASGSTGMISESA